MRTTCYTSALVVSHDGIVSVCVRETWGGVGGDEMLLELVIPDSELFLYNFESLACLGDEGRWCNVNVVVAEQAWVAGLEGGKYTYLAIFMYWFLYGVA